MNVRHAPTEVTESRERHSSAHLHGRRLLLARGIWLVLVVLTLLIFFASLPVYLAQLQTPGTGPAYTHPQLAARPARAAQGLPMCLAGYAPYPAAPPLRSLAVRVA